jgi:formylglycine-generating enzyme required for sulfatase activity
MFSTRPLLLIFFAGFISAGLRAHAVADEPQAFTNSVGMKFVLIPAGEFVIGSPETELGFAGKHLDEETQHLVKIPKDFYLGVYEVTQEEYRSLLPAIAFFSHEGDGKDQVVDILDTGRFPMESISWLEAKNFCRLLTKQEGRTYRLPTEVEWEYAARAGTTSAFHFGDNCNGEQANCKGTFPYGTSAKGPALGRTCPVGSYAPNAFGLYDMHGNVREMCSDEYDGNRYSFIPSDPPGSPEWHKRSYVSRGGGWSSSPVNCRAAFRYDIDPYQRDSARGFRVVCEP